MQAPQAPLEPLGFPSVGDPDGSRWIPQVVSVAYFAQLQVCDTYGEGGLDRAIVTSH